MLGPPVLSPVLSFQGVSLDQAPEAVVTRLVAPTQVMNGTSAGLMGLRLGSVKGSFHWAEVQGPESPEATKQAMPWASIALNTLSWVVSTEIWLVWLSEVQAQDTPTDLQRLSVRIWLSIKLGSSPS